MIAVETLKETWSNNSLSTVPADGLAPLGARPSAGTVIPRVSHHVSRTNALMVKLVENSFSLWKLITHCHNLLDLIWILTMTFGTTIFMVVHLFNQRFLPVWLGSCVSGTLPMLRCRAHYRSRAAVVRYQTSGFVTQAAWIALSPMKPNTFHVISYYLEWYHTVLSIWIRLKSWFHFGINKWY